MAAPIVAPPTRNETQNTIAAATSYERGTDTDITLDDATDFPNAAHVIRIRNADNTKWCLVIYSSKAGDVLSMAAADDYALEKNVTVGDAAYEWLAGSVVEIVCAADEIGQIMAPIAAAGAGEVFFEESGVLKTDSGFAWDNTDKQLILAKTAIGVTQGDYGLKLINTTAAAAGAQQYSPPAIWQGQGWKTDATAETQAVTFRAFVRPIQDAAAPTGAWDLQASINGGAFSDLLSILSSGKLGINGVAAPEYSIDVYCANLSPAARFHRETNTVGQAIYLDLSLLNNASEKTSYGRIVAKPLVNTDGSEDGTLAFRTMQGGTVLDCMSLIKDQVGIGISASLLGRLHVDQASTTAAIPVLVLDQADDSEGFINFIGTSAASAVGPISTWTGGAAIEGFFAIEINSVRKWVAYRADPTA